MRYRVRSVRRAEIIYAGDEIIVDNRLKSPIHLRTGSVIERDGMIAAVVRGPTLIYWSDDGLQRETCADVKAAVARMRELIGDRERVCA
jgi:hypothetical protein